MNKLNKIIKEVKKEIFEEVHIAYDGILSEEQIKITIKWWTEKAEKIIHKVTDEMEKEIIKIKEFKNDQTT